MSSLYIFLFFCTLKALNKSELHLRKDVILQVNDISIEVLPYKWLNGRLLEGFE